MKHLCTDHLEFVAVSLTETKNLPGSIVAALDENRASERTGHMISTVVTSLRKFLADRTGATAIEYSLIAAAVFLGIVPLIAAMDTKMSATYQAILGYFSSI
jgi:Flp pilus assembly pilin Flp